jgi:hypothetical protein
MSPLLYEHRYDLSVNPGFVDAALAAPFRIAAAIGLPCPSPGSVLVFYRVFFAFFGVLALTFALRSFGINQKLAVLVAFWVYVDPGVTAYKPFIGLLLWTTEGFDRYYTPLVGAPIFFVAWGCLARSVLAERRRAPWIIIGGVAAGLLFYTTFLYWTLFLAVALTSVLPDLRRRLGTVSMLLVIAAIISFRYWIYAVAFRQSPYYADVLWRADWCAHGRGVCFVANKTMWLFVLGAITVWRLAKPEARLLVVNIIGGLACFYSSLVTGMDTPNSLQSNHWNIGLAPMVIAGCVWSCAEWINRGRFARFERHMYSVLAAVLAVGGIRVYLDLSRVRSRELAAPPSTPGTGEEHPAYEPAWKWLRDNTPRDAVVLASEPTMGYLPLQTGRYVWSSEQDCRDALSFEEILDRNRVMWAFEGLSPGELEARFGSRFQEVRFTHAIWTWTWGLTTPLVQGLREDRWPPLEQMRWRLFMRTVVDLVAKTTPDELRAIGSRYKVDYVLRGPDERGWTSVEQYVALTPVFVRGGVRIDHVDGWLTKPPQGGRRGVSNVSSSASAVSGGELR